MLFGNGATEANKNVVKTKTSIAAFLVKTWPKWRKMKWTQDYDNFIAGMCPARP
jgi:hypothetical protein